MDLGTLSGRTRARNALREHHELYLRKLGFGQPHRTRRIVTPSGESLRVRASVIAQRIWKPGGVR